LLLAIIIAKFCKVSRSLATVTSKPPLPAGRVRCQPSVWITRASRQWREPLLASPCLSFQPNWW